MAFPSDEQIKTIYAFMKASKECAVSGVNKEEKLTNRSICIRKKMSEIRSKLKLTKKEIENIRKSLNKNPKEANPAKAITRGCV